MFQPNDEVSISLTAGEWNQIIAILGEQPYKISAPLILKISGQAQSQMEAPAGAALNGGGNGEAVVEGPPKVESKPVRAARERRGESW